MEPVIRVKLNSRIDFLRFLPKNSICAELGCWKGDFSLAILDVTEPNRFFMVDPYWKAYGDTFPWRNYGTVDCFTKAMYRIRFSPNYKATTVVIEYDTVFLEDYPDNFFDWIYLDSNHEYEQTALEIQALKAKVKDNGLICGHDYNSPRAEHAGVTIAIDEWLAKNKEYELRLLDNHMQWIVMRKEIPLQEPIKETDEEIYERYIKTQIRRAKRTAHMTRKRDDRRQWILNRMGELGVDGKSILCVGARDISEINFFKNKGFFSEGIDIYSPKGIIECDMSKMLEHPYLKDKKYDIVLSCESIEHCFDLSGFIDGLNVVCNRYFVCMCPSYLNSETLDEIGRNEIYWDCSLHEFMSDNNKLGENLAKTFEQFNVLTSEVYKNGKRLFFILEKK